MVDKRAPTAAAGAGKNKKKPPSANPPAVRKQAPPVVGKPDQAAPQKPSESAPTTQVNNAPGAHVLEIEQVLDPWYSDMICFNCGGLGHYVENCVKPKSCFICQQGHNVNNCAAWLQMHPTATFFGSAAMGLGCYHVDVPVANETTWLKFWNCVVVNVIKGEVSQQDLLVHLSTIFCKQRQWPWQVRELSSKTFLVRFPPWKKAND